MFANNMTLLLNKIENRLGVKMLNLPDNLKKEKWAEEVIIPDTLVTWSRYFPHQFRYHITAQHPMKDGWYMLDEDVFGDCKILGVTNLDWSTFISDIFGGNWRYYDFMAGGMEMADMINQINQANVTSLFNNGIYIVFEPPCRFKLESTYGRECTMNDFWVYVLIEHNPDLTTISATQMETFEALAQADVAGYLYNNLKYFQDLQTVYASINMKIDDLEQQYQKREDIINYIKESYVSAANKNQPIMFTI